MSEFYPDPITFLRTEESLARSRGICLGGILLHAVEKQAMVTDIRRRKAAEKNYEMKRKMAKELDKQKDKLAFRSHDAQFFIDAHPEIRVTELVEGQDVYKGILRAVNLHRATLCLESSSKENVEVPFAAEVPVPPGLNQTYYGHELIIAIDVLSMPRQYVRHL